MSRFWISLSVGATVYILESSSFELVIVVEGSECFTKELFIVLEACEYFSYELVYVLGDNESSDLNLLLCWMVNVSVSNNYFSTSCIRG